jgi:NAD(P)-dependent dehydrogenase (short-subunit alcohol dehydrogenase family)
MSAQQSAPSAPAASSAKWSAADVPDLTGRVAVITGANSGIGYEAALVLARRGAQVVLACRSAERAREAAARIAAAAEAAPAPKVIELDLGSLASIRGAAEELRERHPRIDLLINNAGVMDVPYGTTEDGFELQLGINHLGHFALTGLLMSQLTAVSGSRIVNISSVAHDRGRFDFDDLAFTRGYTPTKAYARSKLANLLFTFELNRRLTAAAAPTVALSAHPGLSRTDLYRHEKGPVSLVIRLISPVLMQSAAMGALPTLRAATDPEAVAGTYYGPCGRAQFKGRPIPVKAVPAAYDAETARQLWAESEKLTGVSFPS